MDLWVYAPEAGSYNLDVIHSRSSTGWATELSMAVNGTTVKAKGTITDSQLATLATKWKIERKNWGNVTLNAGYNVITFGGNQDHAFSGFIFTGPNASN